MPTRRAGRDEGKLYKVRVALPGSMDMLWNRSAMYWLSKWSSMNWEMALSGAMPASRWYQRSRDISVMQQSTIMMTAQMEVSV